MSLKTVLVAFFLQAVSTVSAAADIKANSALGQRLLQNARSLNDNNQDADLSFIIDYSIKFQGCHHVQQWNNNVDEDNDVRIMTKRLARFRLCPSDQCSNDKSAGCTSHFGDYIVDMDTFVEAYLEAMENEKEELCGDAYNTCYYDYCGQSGDADCLTECYAANDLSMCGEANGEDNGFNAQEYAACAQFDLQANNNNRRHLEDQAQEYFIGAFCADQGGEIHLGLFTDDTCTTFANNGYSLFYGTMGFALPYSETSLVSTRCLTCGQDQDGNGYYESKEVCENIYSMSGKCETRMDIDYPNESSCNYIEGIKIIREDGVIRTSATKKSKAAAVAIGLFLTVSVLLAAYVYYLRTKLGRAQINLAASTAPLT